MNIVDYITKLHDWFKGDINRDGEKQLEAFAQQDDFAREALEGYRSFPEQQHELAIDRIKTKLQQQSNQKKGFPWIRIAASIMLLLGVGTMFWMMNRPGLNKELAQAATSKTAIKSLPSTAMPKANAVENEKEIKPDSYHQERAKIKPKKEAKAANAPSKKRSVMPAPKQKDAPEEEDAFVIELPVEDKLIIETNRGAPEEDASDTDVAMNGEMQPVAPSMVLVDGIPLDSIAAVDNKKLFKGIVKSIDEQPLAGVKITTLGTNTTTLTNIDGKFVVEYTPDLKALLLESKDYEPLNIPIAKQENLTLYLSKEDKKLKRVAKKRKKFNLSIEHISEDIVEPKEGFQNFGVTVEQAIEYPPAAKLAKIEGDVELTFIVLPDGAISNVKVLESPDAALSAEAVRVFEHLPNWINNTGKAHQLTYSVPFRIK